MKPSTDPAATSLPRKKPRLALALATVFGVGYIPKAPGTFGSLIGVILAVIAHPITLLLVSGDAGFGMPMVHGLSASVLSLLPAPVVLLVCAAIGVWSASRAAEFSGSKDPQHIVIDEVSGQHLTLMLALTPLALPAQFTHNPDFVGYAIYFALSLLNWKYLLAGFILFRVFDIWKPYPVRRLEKLPRGWGIMADDWMAAIYAALVLRLVNHLGLL
jgi:phosphatidylglycerophosphatase A